MRRALSVLVPVLLAAAPAAAKQAPPPSPCEAYIPTGKALPRPAVSNSRTYLMATPTPSWRDRPVATLRRSEHVTIIRECGSILRIRNGEGAEGWVPVATFVDELRLQRLALANPPRSEAECQARNRDPDAAEDCRADFRKRRALTQEWESSRFLSADEIETLLAGNTLEVWERGRDKAAVTTTRHYFAPDGQYFMFIDQGGMSTRWRGWYTIEGDTLCFPEGFQPCAKLRRMADGGTLWVRSEGLPDQIAVSQGDTLGVVTEVTRRYPKPARPPVPAGLAGADGPMMGR